MKTKGKATIMLPYILTDNSLTIVVDGKALTMESSNPSFNEATKLLTEERFDELPDLFDIPKAVEKFADGNSLSLMEKCAIKMR